MEAKKVMTSIEEIKTYFDPVRRRILKEMLAGAQTVNEVSGRLGVPFKRLYYQFGLLERHGFIKLIGRRTFPGSVDEKQYAVTAEEVTVAPHLLTLDEGGQDGLGAVLESTIDEAKREIRASAASGSMQLDQAENGRLYLYREVLFMTEEEADQLAMQIEAARERYAKPREGSVPHGLLFGLYPRADEDVE